MVSSIIIWPNYSHDRQFKRLSTMEVSDFGCFLILSSGVVLLQQTGKVVLCFHEYMLYNFFLVLFKFNILLILFYLSSQMCCDRYQLNISYDPRSRNNKTICGLQCFRGEHKFISLNYGE